MTKSLWLVSMEFSVLFQTAHLFCVHKLEDIGEICLERFHLTLKHVLLAYEYMNICIYTNILYKLDFSVQDVLKAYLIVVSSAFSQANFKMQNI